MNRLLDIIDNRPVFILLPGKSIERLESHILCLKGKKICYTSINRFNTIEQNILSKIGERFSLIHCHANPGLEQFTPSLVKFLKRKDKNMLMTTTYAASFFNSKYPDFISEFREKIWLTVDFQHIRANSLTAFLVVLMTAGVKTIILFGSDGCVDESRKGQVASYYHSENFEPDRTCALTRDTVMFNTQFPLVMDEYNKKGTKIFNCSPGTHIHRIPKITYENLYKYI